MNMIELQNDEQFLKKLSVANSAEEIHSLLSSYGIEMSDEDVKTALSKANKELSEEDLDKVAGGVVGEILGGIAVLCFLIGLARGSRCK